MVILTVILAAIAAVAMLPVISDLLSLLRSMGGRPAPLDSSESPRLLFLVPAHNEEELIGLCVRSLRSLRYPSNRFAVTVIADNCTDRTAVLARAGGASCLERHDPALPGKPRAIAWALAQVPLDAYDAVIIIDADTTVDPDFAAALARVAPLNDKVFQAYFGVANPEDSALTQMAAVLAAGNFLSAYPLKRRVGVNAPLLGNGMCIGSGVLSVLGWKAFTIAEDWELYALYTAAGVRIESLEGARLYSQEARSLRQSSSQRQRWTAGKLTVLIRHIRGLVGSSQIGWLQKLDAAAELSAPGPVVQLGSALAASALILLFHFPGAMWLMLALWLPVVRLAIYSVVGLARSPHPFRSAAAFVFLPLYLIWRCGIVLASLKMVGDKPWVRTTRN